MHSQILTLIEFKSVPTCWILALLSKTQRRFGVGKRPSPGRTGHANVCYTDQQQHFLPNWVDSFNFIRSRATYDKHFDKFKLAALHIQQSRTLHFMIFNSCYKTSKYSSVMDTHKMDMISIPLANATNMPSRAQQRSDFNFTFHFTVLILIRLSLFLHPLSMDFTVDVPAPPHYPSTPRYSSGMRSTMSMAESGVHIAPFFTICHREFDVFFFLFFF